MQFEIEVTAEAEADLDDLRAFDRRQILEAIEVQLSRAPTQVSRSRIKRLRLLESPAYRLRVGEFRVYYDVDTQEAVVTILRVLSKARSLRYVAELETEP